MYFSAKGRWKASGFPRLERTERFYWYLRIETRLIGQPSYPGCIGSSENGDELCGCLHSNSRKQTYLLQNSPLIFHKEYGFYISINTVGKF